MHFLKQIQNQRSLFMLVCVIVLLFVFSIPGYAQGSDDTKIFLPLIKKTESQPNPDPEPENGPGIGTIATNLADYPNAQLPRYEKLELTFDIETVAENLYFSYDADPPPGIKPGVGITVDALFTSDNWQTIYIQPAFYYQDFLQERRDNKDWIYPSGDFFWKVRFSPNQTGEWQYKIKAQDAGGITETTPISFTVVSSNNKGFVRVSRQDPRYFEFENGELFLGSGYNLTFAEINWDNPTTNAAQFEKFQQNGLQFFRTWLSHWGIYSSAWGAWNSPLPERHAEYIPFASSRMEQTYDGRDVAMMLDTDWNPGMFLGFMKQQPAVKPNTTYHVSMQYLIPQKLQGPRISGHPYGLVAKTGGWLTGPGSWPDNQYGFTNPGTGTLVTNYVFQSPLSGGIPQWATLDGEITTGNNQNFLPYFYLVLENISQGKVYIDQIEIREDLGNGQYGPNIVSKPQMSQHKYIDQRQSYAFDEVLALSNQYDIYFKLVVLEKNEWILNRIDFDGNPVPEDPRCWDSDPENNPPTCPDNKWFYGNWREMTKVRWLQQAWWRYLQARWGYSPHIHSWELLNEGDPWNGLHYTLADEFGKYMHQFAPNDHLVTTSFWHSFPKNDFWKNPEYSHVDYADLHAYSTDSLDTAADSQYYSQKYGAKQPEGTNKPLIRGETGFSNDVTQDSAGIWLHNYIWVGVNSGGMYEQYWYGKEHIQKNNLNYHYKAYNNFMDDIPLNNGMYQDIAAVNSNQNLRVWGQKDVVNQQAHVWLQNKNHTWRNVVDGAAISPVSETIEISGFQPGQSYQVEWWDTYQPDKSRQIMQVNTISSSLSGIISIPVNNLTSDVAIKISTTP